MRQILDFNENWWFIHADVDVSEARPGEGELVSLPHTWNAPVSYTHLTLPTT